MTRPAVSPLKEITDQMKVELLKLTTANGYVTNLPIDADPVTKDPDVWMTFQQHPCIYITYAQGTEIHGINKWRQIDDEIQLIVRFIKQADTVLTDQVAEFLTDLRELINQNPTLNDGTTDLCTMWKIGSRRTDLGVNSPVAMLVIRIEVRYFV